MVDMTVGLKGWDLMGHFMELEAQLVSLGTNSMKKSSHTLKLTI